MTHTTPKPPLPSVVARSVLCWAVGLWLVALSMPVAASAQSTRILFVGDSITQGGKGFASYRYPLYFDLLANGYDVDFVGSLDGPHNGVTPSASLYPDYFTTFDRDHQAYWGRRTDQIEPLVQDAARDHQPEVVVIHLGTNDIGQNGAAGVAAAQTNLQDIVGLVRLEVPTATFVLSKVIPIGPGAGGYGANAGQVGPLNTAIETVAAALDTPQSPVLVTDPNLGFQLGTMMQSDQLHPNDLGEQFIAGVFRATLETVLTPGNPAPSVALTAPSAGASFVAPSTVTLAADAVDPNGSVTAVDFFVDGSLLGTDSTEPFTFDWNASSTGTYVLAARATDDQGATRLSEPVTVSVTSGGGGTSIAVANPSFELPTLGDGAVRNATGVPDWTFTGTSATYRGVFNPPVGSYPTAGGQGTPPGADGAQVAFLFNNGGPSQSVTAHQDLGEIVQAGRDYTLRVAIGRFDPGQPYAPSTYGGYRIELLAGGTVIATDVDTVDPTLHTFEDAVAVASSIPTSLVGQPLTIRLGLSTTQAQRSTHFDDVRLEASPAAGGNLPPSVTLTSPAAGTVLSPATLSLAATAADTDGTVAEVRFYAGATLLATDPTAPYSFDWTSVPAGTYALTAVAEDDGGATATSAAVTVVVEDPVTGGTVAVANPSFELPALTDGTVRNATGVPDWTFVGTSQTYRGVFNPPVGSYPTAGGQGTPPGADGAQVAFLFNNGGPSQSVTAHQDLGETVQAGRDYTLRVAIGKFDPGQPYAPSTYGGYRIELLAGGTVIASDVDTVDPALHTFEDAVAVVPAASIPPALVGQPLTIRLGLSTTQAQRSTHFDDVRLEWELAVP